MITVNGKKLIIIRGDITEQKVDVIVNAANSQLIHGGGVARAIASAAGPELIDASDKMDFVPTGNAVITTAGKLAAKKVIHTVGPVWQGGDNNEANLLKSCINNTLNLAKNYKTIAFPSISTGIYRFPIEQAAEILLKNAYFHLKYKSDSIEEISFVLFSENDYKIYHEILASLQCEVSSPGRIVLFGEHQDYLGLPVIPAAISLRIYIRGDIREDNKIQIELPDIDTKMEFELEKEIKYSSKRDYLKSAVNLLQRNGYTFSNGFDCTVKGEIPINSGTSSSSALVVSWINFLTRMSDQRKILDRETIAKYAYLAEVEEFGEPGGMQDHYATATGKFFYIDPYPETRIERLDGDIGVFVLGDSQLAKDTVGNLQRIKNTVNKIIEKINIPGFVLSQAKTDDLVQYSENLDNSEIAFLLGMLRNHEITLSAKKILSEAIIDPVKLGELINEQHHILRDIFKTSIDKIDKMVEAAINAGAYGAKINGSGGGGCMFAYTPKDKINNVVDAIVKSGGIAYVIEIDEGTRFENVLCI